MAWCCGVATQHKLDSLVSSETVIQKQVSHLTHGLTDALNLISTNSEKFSHFANECRSAFNATDARLHKITNYINNLINTTTHRQEFSIAAILFNLKSHFANLRRFIQINRILKRQNILDSCRNHQIPSLIVNSKILQHDLEILSAQINFSGRGLAIPLSDISKFYKLPICHCAFTETKLYIHIRIPIIRNTETWRLYELLSTPFAWYNQTCSIQHQTLYLAVSESTLTGTNFIKQISGTALHQCKPYENKLCYLPRFAADSAHGPGCAKILYVGSSISEINQHCPLHCITSQLLSISEIAHDTFVITHPQPDLTITCKNHKTLLPNTFHSTPGALKLKLPCYCRMSSQTYDLIPERYPSPENQPLNLRMHHSRRMVAS